MEIKLSISPSEKLAVYQFRYSVIVEELGVAIPSANQTEKTVRDADDEKGHLFAALDGGKLVGTVRINFLREGDVFPHSELLRLSQSPTAEAASVCSRFLVAKEHRGSLLTVRMMQTVYRFMRQSGIEFDFILVKQDLADLYIRIGYQPYGRAVTHPEIGDVVPLRLGVFDEGHLRSVRSPLVQCLDSSSRGKVSDVPQGRGVQTTMPAEYRERAFSFLSEECVIGDRKGISRYENNVTAFVRTVPLILRPDCITQIEKIVGEANRLGIPLYPISTGKNWGLGSRLPTKDNTTILDLSRLNHVLEVNEALRYVVLEPGVTQGQLARYLVDHHPSLSFNLTGAFGETGVLGNTLERGDGMHARIDDLIGLGGVLGNGEPFEVGGNSDETAGPFSRYAAGPDVVGLFTQSNFAVVTRMTFRLITKNEQLCLLWGTVRHEKLSELFDHLQRLFAQRIIEPAMTNVGYANRFEQARKTLGDTTAEASQPGSSWNFYIIVNAIPRISQVIREEATAALRSCCETMGHYVNGQGGDNVPVFVKPLLNPLCGCPDYDSIKLVYQLTGTALPSDPRDIDLDQTPFGMKSYVALVPPIGEHVLRAAQIVTIVKERLRANIKISFFGDGRTLVTIHFLKSDPQQVSIAEQAEAEIWEQMTAAGYGPYRVNIGQMERLFKLRPRFFNLVSLLKTVFDPNGIISPGRYCPG